MSVTHVAGPTIAYNGRAVQRCMVCGEKLCDNLRQMSPVLPDGSPPEFLHWAEGHLVQIDGNRQTDIGEYGNANPAPLPDDSCWALVEE